MSRKLAERAVYFELILIFLGGVLGTGHHLYWAGGPSMWVPLGSMFSFIEVLPLVLLIIEAIQHHQLIKRAAGVQIYGSPIPTSSARRSGTSSAPACSAAAR